MKISTGESMPLILHGIFGEVPWIGQPGFFSSWERYRMMNMAPPISLGQRIIFEWSSEVSYQNELAEKV
jgi:hypothetical protein